MDINTIAKMPNQPIEFNKTYTMTLKNISFGDFPPEILNEMFKNGSLFSHFGERIIANEFDLKHIIGCKDHDLVDQTDSTIKYDEKTFTKGGCKFMPSSMIGTGRKFDKAIFDEKSKNMIYVIVSNINFPEIKIRFVKGPELAALYPTGEIKFSQYDKFFNQA